MMSSALKHRPQPSILRNNSSHSSRVPFFTLPQFLLVFLFLLLLSPISSQAHNHPEESRARRGGGGGGGVGVAMKPRGAAFSSWAAGGLNCTCARELNLLKKEVEEERVQRLELKGALETYVSELYDVRALVQGLVKNGSAAGRGSSPKELAPAEGSSSRRTPSISFSAKLSYNRELKPLDTVIFDTVLTNNGQAYSAETGKFTTPLPGTYVFFATILSGYNTKVESALIVNDKEVARMYSGAHDAHGSGSNAAILNLRSGDSVWVRLLFQGGSHVHGFYSSFSGAILAEEEQQQQQQQ
ncbi:uncharacterized protein LOC143300710 [Babylonia areolata]|uniref:uncharacterized protein LOC143300710 n=1 Tax=Babylonia areolata TaxID=304850 RepID=UPI003FD0C657